MAIALWLTAFCTRIDTLIPRQLNFISFTPGGPINVITPLSCQMAHPAFG